MAKSRFAHLAGEAQVFLGMSRQISLPLPGRDPGPDSAGEWIEYGKALASRFLQVEAVQAYFSRLQALVAARPFEEISKLRSKLTTDLAANSEALWEAWLRLQPARMTPQQRKLLGDYSSILQMVVSANESNQQLGRDVFRRYYQLFPSITSILPCWAVTSLSARGRVPFEAQFFDLLVIDEASQCDIASILPLLFRSRRVAVIGDPKQLRHISMLSKHQDQQLLAKHGLLEDFPGWAYSTRSVFDLASSLCRSEDIVNLRDHHRSHADIIEFSNEEFYEGRLRVATNYDLLRRPSSDGPAVRWVRTSGQVARPGTGGAVNEREAIAVVAEIERLISQGYRGSIGVVSPFRAQANRIRDLIFQRDDLSRRVGELDLLVDTVHRFQGDERDVMVFSPVVSTGISNGALGFLRNSPNLFNVAITRARAALVVVGDHSSATSSDIEYLSRFASYVNAIGQRLKPAFEPDPDDLGPEYPPVSNPEQVSDWERLLYRFL